MERLIFCSPHFNPLEVLYAKEELPVPDPTAPVFESLLQYVEVVRQGIFHKSDASQNSEISCLVGISNDRKKVFIEESFRAGLKQASSEHFMTSSVGAQEENIDQPKKKPCLESTAHLLERTFGDGETVTDASSDVYIAMKAIEDEAKLTSKSKLRKSSLRREKFQHITKPNVELVHESRKKHVKSKSILDKMNELQVGPYSVLFNCVHNGVKLKVWTRRYKGLRSVLSGYLIAFDCHMNLAMIDVDELYTIETWMVDHQTVKKKRAKKKKKNVILRDINDKDLVTSRIPALVPLSRGSSLHEEPLSKINRGLSDTKCCVTSTTDYPCWTASKPPSESSASRLVSVVEESTVINDSKECGQDQRASVATAIRNDLWSVLQNLPCLSSTDLPSGLTPSVNNSFSAAKTQDDAPTCLHRQPESATKEDDMNSLIKAESLSDLSNFSLRKEISSIPFASADMSDMQYASVKGDGNYCSEIGTGLVDGFCTTVAARVDSMISPASRGTVGDRSLESVCEPGYACAAGGAPVLGNRPGAVQVDVMLPDLPVVDPVSLKSFVEDGKLTDPLGLQGDCSHPMNLKELTSEQVSGNLPDLTETTLASSSPRRDASPVLGVSSGEEESEFDPYMSDYSSSSDRSYSHCSTYSSSSLEDFRCSSGTSDGSPDLVLLASNEGDAQRAVPCGNAFVEPALKDSDSHSLGFEDADVSHKPSSANAVVRVSKGVAYASSPLSGEKQDICIANDNLRSDPMGKPARTLAGDCEPATVLCAHLSSRDDHLALREHDDLLSDELQDGRISAKNETERPPLISRELPSQTYQYDGIAVASNADETSLFSQSQSEVMAKSHNPCSGLDYAHNLQKGSEMPGTHDSPSHLIEETSSDMIAVNIKEETFSLEEGALVDPTSKVVYRPTSLVTRDCQKNSANSVFDPSGLPAETEFPLAALDETPRTSEKEDGEIESDSSDHLEEVLVNTACQTQRLRGPGKDGKGVDLEAMERRTDRSSSGNGCSSNRSRSMKNSFEQDRVVNFDSNALLALKRSSSFTCSTSSSKHESGENLKTKKGSARRMRQRSLRRERSKARLCENRSSEDATQCADKRTETSVSDRRRHRSYSGEPDKKPAESGSRHSASSDGKHVGKVGDSRMRSSSKRRNEPMKKDKYETRTEDNRSITSKLSSANERLSDRVKVRDRTSEEVCSRASRISDTSLERKAGSGSKSKNISVSDVQSRKRSSVLQTKTSSKATDPKTKLNGKQPGAPAGDEQSLCCSSSSSRSVVRDGDLMTRKPLRYEQTKRDAEPSRSQLLQSEKRDSKARSPLRRSKRERSSESPDRSPNSAAVPGSSKLAQQRKDLDSQLSRRSPDERHKASRFKELELLREKLLKKERMLSEQLEKEKAKTPIAVVTPMTPNQVLLSKVMGATVQPRVLVQGVIHKRRHVNQLFIRGDNVVLVAYDKPELVSELV